MSVFHVVAIRRYGYCFLRGVCYHLSEANDKKDYYNSVKYCNDMRAVVASPTKQEEIEQLANIAKEGYQPSSADVLFFTGNLDLHYFVGRNVYEFFIWSFRIQC